MNGLHALVLRESPLPRTRRGSAAESSTIRELHCTTFGHHVYKRQHVREHGTQRT